MHRERIDRQRDDSAVAPQSPPVKNPLSLVVPCVPFRRYNSFRPTGVLSCSSKASGASVPRTRILLLVLLFYWNTALSIPFSLAWSSVAVVLPLSSLPSPPSSTFSFRDQHRRQRPATLWRMQCGGDEPNMATRSVETATERAFLSHESADNIDKEGDAGRAADDSPIPIRATALFQRAWNSAAPLHWFATALGTNRHQHQRSQSRWFLRNYRGGGSSSGSLVVCAGKADDTNDGDTALLSPPTLTTDSVTATADKTATASTESVTNNFFSAANGANDKATTTGTAASSMATTTPSTSVHLQLTDPTLLDPSSATKDSDNSQASDDDKEESSPNDDAEEAATKILTIHTYRDASSNTTWKALNTAKHKFQAFLHYRGAVQNANDAATLETVQLVLEASTTSRAKVVDKDTAQQQTEASSNSSIPAVVVDLEDMRKEWRLLWKSGHLLTDRTELLAVYPSDDEIKAAAQQLASTTTPHAHESSQAPSKVARKRGGFADLLQLYTDRVLAMLHDEREDATLPTLTSSNDTTRPNHQDASNKEDGLLSTIAPTNHSGDLLQWLESSYGISTTRELLSDKLRTLPEPEQLAKLKTFLEWFRSQFPYFYDRCDACGASIKEDTAAAAASTTPTQSAAANPTDSKDADNSTNEEADDTDKEDSDHRTFVGYTYPDSNELRGKASRTELYQCHVCGAFTRFPRYNSATHVIEHRRGRCGEYSMLLFRLLRALNHECRWVVDWADHVWAEVLLPSSTAARQESSRRWVHLDPCEAAVDENFIYQDWGKKQTFILGFYLPARSTEHGHDADDTSLAASVPPCSNIGKTNGYIAGSEIPLIEDITQYYTREPWSAVCERRDESDEQVQASIARAVIDLQGKLVQFSQSLTTTSTSLPAKLPQTKPS